MNLPTLPLGLGIFLLLATQPGHAAGPIREWLMERRAAKMQEKQQEAVQTAASRTASYLPEGARLLRDLAYGSDPAQRLDVYLPREAKNAPVIFMVHGGAWRMGDKSLGAVVENKVARWVTRGFILVSVNYRLLPQAAPLQQAQDVALAMAAAQGQAASWGGDPARFILMGHSSGAHLAALLASSPAIAKGTQPWLGTVLLDSAALNVARLMQASHYGFHDAAFGANPQDWPAVSPFHLLSGPAAPILAVCSSRRDDSCAQAQAFVDKAQSLGIRASLHSEDLAHQEINDALGSDSPYTQAVEAFMGSLDSEVQQRLAAL
jgi:acetyl esterase/lipase